jgi:IS5 family transposase
VFQLLRAVGKVTIKQGRAMAKAVSRRPLTAKARVRSRDIPRGIRGGQSGTSVFACQFHSTGAPLQGKTKKINQLHHRVAQ